MIELKSNLRKIIHVDMDCFFAAVEIRDNPKLIGKPVAVGGRAVERGVLSTCSYEARKYGLHSAMPTAQAQKLCPKLILLPVNIKKYQEVSSQLCNIFKKYTPVVEMLSLDEAFLDVTNCQQCRGSATLIAKAIKYQIKSELHLNASAGVAPNKFLAKVASDWDKPDGLYVITPDQVVAFVKTLPVTKIIGVGKVTARVLRDIGIKTCLDLQALSLLQLKNKFGKFGERIYYLCRGIDERMVEPYSIRKSISIEETYPRDIARKNCINALSELIPKLKSRLPSIDEPINKQFVKIKFGDFKITTAEVVSNRIDDGIFFMLLEKGLNRHSQSVRLLGIGVKLVV